MKTIDDSVDEILKMSDEDIYSKALKEFGSKEALDEHLNYVRNKINNYCDECHDGDGNSVYPYYGVAPHNCFYKIGKDIGQSELKDQSNLPENFVGDEESIIDGKYCCGVYTHCLKCGAK